MSHTLCIDLLTVKSSEELMSQEEPDDDELDELLGNAPQDEPPTEDNVSEQDETAETPEDNGPLSDIEFLQQFVEEHDARKGYMPEEEWHATRDKLIEMEASLVEV